jgi:Prokaryotic glutathione synthetase, ATP-grasp domain
VDADAAGWPNGSGLRAGAAFQGSDVDLVEPFDALHPARAVRRVPTGNDPRANISTGGRSVPLEIGDVERGIVAAMSKKLVADGM